MISWRLAVVGWANNLTYLSNQKYLVSESQASVHTNVLPSLFCLYPKLISAGPVSPGAYTLRGEITLLCADMIRCW